MHPKPFRRLVLAGLFTALCSLAPAVTSPADLASLRAKAENGNAIAQYNLGLIYADTREPAHEPAEAYLWLTLAAEAGATGRALSSLMELLTPTERTEGDRRLAARRAATTTAAPARSPLITSAPLPAGENATVQIAALEASKRQLSDELSRARQENEALRVGSTATAEFRQHVAIAESALATKDREIATLRERLTLLENSPTASLPDPAITAALQSRVAELTARLATTELALTESRPETAATLNTARAQIATRDARIAQLARDLAASSDHRVASAEATAQAAEARRLLATRETALADARAQITQLETRLTSAVEQNSSSAVATQEAAALREQLTLATAEAAETRRILASREAALAEARAQIAQLETRDTRLAELTAQLTTAHQVTEKQTDQLNFLRAQLAELVGARDEALARADAPAEPSAALTELQTKLDNSLRAYGVQQRELRQLQTNLADRETLSSELDAELARTRADLANARADLAALSPDLTAAQDRAETALAATAAVNAEVEALRLQLDAARATAATQERSLALTATTATELASAITAAQAEADRLREELRFAQSQNTTLAQGVDELRTRLTLIPPSTATNRATPLRPGQVPAISPSAPPPPIETFLPTIRPTSPPVVPTITTPPTTTAPPAAIPSEPRTHTVMPGETLSIIALNYYGDANRWPELFEANRDHVASPGRLGAGTLLRIP